MKRTPLERRTELRRTGELRRTAPTRRRKTNRGEFPAKVRGLMWARQDGACAVCGDPLPLLGWTGHHRRPRGQGGSYLADTYSPANGLAVHELPCHRWIENNPTKAEAKGWRVAQGTDPATVPVTLFDGRRVLLDHLGRAAELTTDDTGEAA